MLFLLITHKMSTIKLLMTYNFNFKKCVDKMVDNHPSIFGKMPKNRTKSINFYGLHKK